jgi:hypothetical protein
MINKDKLDFINQIVEETEKQRDIHTVNSSALEDGKIPVCKTGTHKWDYNKRYMQKSCTVCDVHYLA